MHDRDYGRTYRRLGSDLPLVAPCGWWAAALPDRAAQFAHDALLQPACLRDA